VTVASTDLFYDPRERVAASWTERGATAVEMEAATVLQVAGRRGVAAACVLGVSDAPTENGARRMNQEDLAELGVRIGEAGYAAVTSR
jgi:purine-nucleoside phosphorylase